jgi:hypothetical protein
MERDLIPDTIIRYALAGKRLRLSLNVILKGRKAGRQARQEFKAGRREGGKDEGVNAEGRKAKAERPTPIH